MKQCVSDRLSRRGLRLETIKLSHSGGTRGSQDEGRCTRVFDRGPSLDPVDLPSGVIKKKRVHISGPD